MHKICLEPKDPYELCADGSGAGVEAACVLNSKDPSKFFDCFPKPVLSLKSAEERLGAVNNIIFPYRVISQVVGG